MIDWFFKKGNEFLRSSVCLINMVFTILGIWWIDSINVESITDVIIVIGCIAFVIVNTAFAWNMLDYIYKHDKI